MPRTVVSVTVCVSPPACYVSLIRILSALSINGLKLAVKLRLGLFLRNSAVSA